MADSLKNKLQDDTKTAMRARDKARLGVLRLIAAAIKQQEVDTRTELDDQGTIAVLDKMLKQRRDSEEQYRSAGRTDLAEQESFEIEIILGYMPIPLGEAEIDDMIAATLGETGAESMKDMGKVMAVLRPKVQGRTDMGAVSAKVKQRLTQS